MEAFLEDINNLLNAGEVPNIFPVDEKQEICEKMRQIDRQVTHPIHSYVMPSSNSEAICATCTATGFACVLCN